MNYLDEIIAHKKKEIKRMKKLYPIEVLERTKNFHRNTNSLSDSLMKNPPGIIAEFKRKSPSAGSLYDKTNIAQVVKGYIESGAAALSVLTDQAFFGGNLKDLQEARNQTDLAILRKDFMLDEYQIIEAKAAGADAILLIAEILTKDQVYLFSALARSLSLEVILEVHHPVQLSKLCDQVTVVGVNNRNLMNLTIDVNTSFKLAGIIPGQFIRISESGISSPAIIRKLTDAGYHGFLIGEFFMKHDKPHDACKKLIKEVQEGY